MWWLHSISSASTAVICFAVPCRWERGKLGGLFSSLQCKLLKQPGEQMLDFFLTLCGVLHKDLEAFLASVCPNHHSYLYIHSLSRVLSTDILLDAWGLALQVCPGPLFWVSARRAGGLETLAHVVGFSPSRYGNSSRRPRGPRKATQVGRACHSPVRNAPCCFWGCGKGASSSSCPASPPPRVAWRFGRFAYPGAHAVQVGGSEPRKAL